MARERTRTRSFVRGLLFGVVFSLLFGLAYPPTDLWWLVVVAPVPLLLAARSCSRPLWCAIGVSVATLPMWALHHSWIGAISTLGLPPLALYLSLWPGLFVWMMARLARTRDWVYWLGAPVVWTGLEMLRGEVVWHGYPWFLLAHPMIEWEWFARGAAVFGVYALSLIVCSASALLACAIACRNCDAHRWRNIGIAGACITACTVVLSVVGAGTAASAERAPVRIGVVQTSLPQTIRGAWSLEDRIDTMRRLITLSFAAVMHEPSPDLIVWPETLFPGPTLSADALAELRAHYEGLYPGHDVEPLLFDTTMLQISEQLSIPMIIGARGYDGFRIESAGGDRFVDVWDGTYNSAFVVTDGVIEGQRYDKMHLTPFGEVMPYISNWKWLESRLLALGAAGMAFDLDAGDTPVVLSVETRDGRTIRLATPICFEATISRVCRRLVFDGAERRADVLLNLTNDGWFGAHPGGRAHHLLVSRWRCVELGTPMVRSANTGISSVIDTRGRVLIRGPQSVLEDDGSMRPGGRGDEQRAGVIVGAVEPGAGVTAYGRVGNLVGWICLGLSVCLLVPVIRAGSGSRSSRGPMAEKTNDAPGDSA